jgi:serine/threonine protein kinase
LEDSPLNAFDAPTPEDLSKLLPGYAVSEIVGRGGMGVVYRALQSDLNRQVAIKILPRLMEESEGFIKRFRQEAQALASLSHPNIVSIFDFGEVDGQFYFVMEYVDGLTLRDVIRSGGVPPVEALAMIIQICTALQYTHDQGIVHRDIKPVNLLIDKKGVIKLTDFGLAKLVQSTPSGDALTQTNQQIGTPFYMAPEQRSNADTLDHRVDIYALGVVFYELLTGKLPAGAFTPPSSEVEIDARLDEVVNRAMADNPEKRFQHASDMKTEVDEISRTGSTSPSGTIPNRKRVILAGALYTLMLALVIGLGVWKPWEGNGQESNERLQNSSAKGPPQLLDLREGVQMELAWIPPGSFQMGSPDTEEGRKEDENLHEVTITKGFWMGKYEVTREQWEFVMGRNTRKFKGNRNPEDNKIVNWHGCQKFAEKLNEKVEGAAFRLPTEAEWEYACRAGTSTRYYIGNKESDLDEAAWYAKNRDGFAQEVGRKTPNNWGLYDMLGNASEWCSDWHGPSYPNEPQVDPQGASEGVDKVIRGGFWNASVDTCRSAGRTKRKPSSTRYGIGFRVVGVQLDKTPTSTLDRKLGEEITIDLSPKE